jgi:hypothetical protein
VRHICEREFVLPAKRYNFPNQSLFLVKYYRYAVFRIPNAAGKRCGCGIGGRKIALGVGGGLRCAVGRSVVGRGSSSSWVPFSVVQS